MPEFKDYIEYHKDEEALEHFKGTKISSVLDYILENQLDVSTYTIPEFPFNTKSTIYKCNFEEFSINVSFFYQSSSFFIELCVKDNQNIVKVKRQYNKLNYIHTTNRIIDTNIIFWKYLKDKINNSKAYQIKKQKEQELLKKLDNFEGTL